MKTRLAVFLVAFVLVAGLTAFVNAKVDAKTTGTITRTAYERLEPGLTYKQTIAIAGTPRGGGSTILADGTTIWAFTWNGKKHGTVMLMFRQAPGTPAFGTLTDLQQSGL